MSEFFDACAQGDADALRRLLSVDSGLARATAPGSQFGGWTGLHGAAKSGSVEAVQVLLEHGADPDAREAGDHTTPLHWAAACGNLDVARALLEAGADVHGSGDVHELDVIGWAAVFGNPAQDPRQLSQERRDLIALLVERGARHHIFSAMAIGDLELIRRVVEQNPTALGRRQSRFEHKLTPLHFAVDRKRYDILDLLIALGADVEAQDGRGHTALSFAALRADCDAVRRLHAAGATFPDTTPGVTRPAVAALGASVKKVVPMIYVPDVARALDWYVSIGFTELARYDDNGLVNFGMVALGQAELMLNMHGKAGPQTASVWLYTDQVDAIYQELKSRQLAAVRASLEGLPGPGEIVFEQDIEDMFYGARQFCIRDPHGYEIYFIQPVERSE